MAMEKAEKSRVTMENNEKYDFRGFFLVFLREKGKNEGERKS